jgi:hypothetical protein
VVDLLVGSKGLVDRWSDHTDVPDDQPLLSKAFHKAIFFQEVLYQTGYPVCKAVFVPPIAELDIQVVAWPIFKYQIPDAYPLRDLSCLADVKQLIALGWLFLQFLFQLLLFIEELLLGLVLFVHLLHPSSVQFVKIRELLQMSQALRGKFLIGLIVLFLLFYLFIVLWYSLCI